MSTTRVHYDNFEPLFFEHVNTILSNDDGVNLRVAASQSNLFSSSSHILHINVKTIPSVERNSGLCSILLQLIISPSTEGIRTNKASLPTFFHIVVRQFSTSRCFSGTLKADKHNHICLSFNRLISFYSGVDKLENL